MQYLLMNYVNEKGFAQLSPEQKQQGVAAYMSFVEALRTAGVIKDMGRLQPSANATTVRLIEGKPRVLDGPYADSKEQIGGFFVIEVPDLDAALSWAARCPAAGHGVVEVRPFWQQPM